MLLDGRFEEIAEEAEPEGKRAAVSLGVGVADGLEHLVLVEQAQVRWIEPEGVAIQFEEDWVGAAHARTPRATVRERAVRSEAASREVSAARTRWPRLVRR